MGSLHWVITPCNEIQKLGLVTELYMQKWSDNIFVQWVYMLSQALISCYQTFHTSNCGWVFHSKNSAPCIQNHIFQGFCLLEMSFLLQQPPKLCIHIIHVTHNILIIFSFEILHICSHMCYQGSLKSIWLACILS